MLKGDINASLRGEATGGKVTPIVQAAKKGQEQHQKRAFQLGRVNTHRSEEGRSLHFQPEEGGSEGENGERESDYHGNNSS